MKGSLLMLLISLANLAEAQLCNGSLGDPVSQMSFGTKNDPVSIAGNTTYSLSGGCPDDGQYSFSSLTFGCFDGTWHTVVSDHTINDLNGYMMLVNASIEPGDFFVDTIDNLCSGISYEFSSWVMNMLKPAACGGNGIDPNLTFRIETLAGVVLAVSQTGNIAETEAPTWKQFGVFFKPPAGVTSVVVRIRNNASGGCGNDLALDDIAFRPCGPTINASVFSNGSNVIHLCEGDTNSLLLTGQYSNTYSNPKLQWQQMIGSGGAWLDLPGAESATYWRPPTAPGNYYYRLAIGEGDNILSGGCRIYSNVISVFVDRSPDAQLTNYVYGCYGAQVVLFAAGGSFYQWTGPNGFTSNLQKVTIPEVKFTDAGQYKVRVTTENTCSAVDSMNLVVYPAAVATTIPDISVCEGIPVQLQAAGGIRYKWYPTSSLSNDTIPNPVARPADSTFYIVQVTNEYNCNDTASIRVNIWKKPVANAGPDKKTRPGMYQQLDGSIKGTSVKYHWTPSDFMTSTTEIRPRVNPLNTIVYTLHAESQLGCGISTDNVTVKVYNTVIVPNAFSPNGDGINDTWVIDPLDIFPEANTKIFNRFGDVVFQMNGGSRPWDGRSASGKPLPSGVYYYLIDLRVNKEPPLTGSITIIR